MATIAELQKQVTDLENKLKKSESENTRLKAELEAQNEKLKAEILENEKLKAEISNQAPILANKTSSFENNDLVKNVKSINENETLIKELKEIASKKDFTKQKVKDQFIDYLKSIGINDELVSEIITNK